SSAVVEFVTMAERTVLYATVAYHTLLCPNPLPIFANLIGTVIGSVNFASNSAMAELIVAMMVAALGSLVMVLSNVGTISRVDVTDFGGDVISVGLNGITTFGP